MQREFLLACVALLGLVDGKAADTPELVNDRAITIRTKSEVEAKRSALIRYLWGGEGFPKTRMPDRVLTNVHAPVKHRHRLARVDELRIEQLPDLEGLAYHFIREHPNDELVSQSTKLLFPSFGGRA